MVPLRALYLALGRGAPPHRTPRCPRPDYGEGAPPLSALSLFLSNCPLELQMPYSWLRGGGTSLWHLWVLFSWIWEPDTNLQNPWVSCGWLGRMDTTSQSP